MTFIHVVIDPYNNCLDFIYFLRVCKSLCKQERIVKKKTFFPSRKYSGGRKAK
jgi:hypothetical protein